MKVPLNWLKEYVTLPEDANELGRKLTYIGHMQDGPAKKVAGDTVLDLEVRQNRSDAYSILGIAREVAAVTHQPLEIPDSYEQELPEVRGSTEVRIENEQLCYRFHTLTFEGVTVAPSPTWLQQRLEAYGIPPINNVVDITNFVMLEIGQPLHAFDADTIVDSTLIIRLARAGETYTSLGNQVVELTPDDLIIADPQKVVALAGVMGSKETGVKSSTTRIILEAATYNQASIRRSALRHDLRTEASTRLEKFLHPHLTELALRRAASLILELAGGKVVDHTDLYPVPQKPKSISLRLSEITRLGGITVSANQVQEILELLCIPTAVESEDTLTAQIPYFRTDLEQEADLVEEVLRLYGYDRIPDRLPHQPPPADIQSPMHILEEQVRDIMIATGYDEQITEPLTNEEQPEHPPVLLENSLTSEKIMLRTTLKNTLLQAVQTRRKYRFSEIRVFEVGKIYYQSGESYQEPVMLGLILSGEKASYQEIKGGVEVVFARLQRPYDPNLVRIDQLPDPVPTFFAEVNLEGMLGTLVQESAIVRTSPPQVILQDLSIQVPQDTPVGNLIAAIKALDTVIYRVDLGEPPRELEGGKKSVFLKIAYHSPDTILSNQDVAPIRDRILKHVWQQFDAEI